jgi:sulfite reductase (NADPH) hemoprotein beta-component
MYQYDHIDQAIVDQRVTQFRDQTQRFLKGELAPEAYQPLRLQNGLYIQRHAPMLRVAVPYGTLSSRQLRKLADISRRYDRSYAHVSTRQNVQFNWPELAQVPDILEELAQVQMHAIQTSGNCIRNITTDELAGVALGERIDPRPICEILRQWSTLHPEFAFLPRKFKIAITANPEDRAAILAHDVGIDLKIGSGSEGLVADVYVGGGLGRTPIIGNLVKANLAVEHLITYLEALIRVYNQFGRRDNKYKARIKILVKAMGLAEFAERVDRAWVLLKDNPSTISAEEIARVSAHFVLPDYRVPNENEVKAYHDRLSSDPLFARWIERNTRDHKQEGHRIVTIPLKSHGLAPGDITADQMELVATLAEQYGYHVIRTTHQQNMVLPDIHVASLYEVWQALQTEQLAQPVVNTLNDMICCPGGDFCSLANAKSIPVAQAIQSRFESLDFLYDLGPVELNISGCMNACGHHHIGHIGILGVDKKGREFFQVCLGGRQGRDAAVGKILGPSFEQERIPEIIEIILKTYIDHRTHDETFINTYDRIGIDAFKEAVYADAH